MAAVEPARAGAEGVGGGAGHHDREPVLVVRDVLVGAGDGDAAADVPGGRVEDPGLLHEARRPARPAAGRARPVPAVQVLGAGGVDRLDALDRRGGEEGRRAVRPGAVARLPAAPRLRAAEAGPGGRGDPRRAARARRRGRRPDRLLPRARRARDRAQRVRHRAGLAAGAPQPRAALGGPDRVPDGGRARGDRHRRQRGVRDGRPPDLARVRARPGARRRGQAAVRGRARRRRGARRGRQARVRARPRPVRRRRADRRARRLVHVLLLGGRREGAGLRAHRRYPPQAGLRPGRAVPRPGDQAAAAGARVAARAQEARVPHADGRDPARRGAGEGLARPDPGRPGEGAAADLERAGPARRTASSPPPGSTT